MAKPEKTPQSAAGPDRAEFYHHCAYDCYECMGCNELIEVPWRAVLKDGQQPVAIKENPENRLLWLELKQIEHRACAKFSDAHLAELARQYQKPVLVKRPPGEPGRNQNKAPLAS